MGLTLCLAVVKIKKAMTGCLLEFTKSSNDDKIKPQGVTSKIVIPETNIYAATDSSDLFSPTG